MCSRCSCPAGEAVACHRSPEARRPRVCRNSPELAGLSSKPVGSRARRENGVRRPGRLPQWLAGAHQGGLGRALTPEREGTSREAGVQHVVSGGRGRCEDRRQAGPRRGVGAQRALLSAGLFGEPCWPHILLERCCPVSFQGACQSPALPGPGQRGALNTPLPPAGAQEEWSRVSGRWLETTLPDPGSRGGAWGRGRWSKPSARGQTAVGSVVRPLV